MSNPLISIVIPALNEEANVERVYERLRQILSHENFEVIFVDDGSTDGTSTKISDLARKFPNIRGISFSRNFGHQAALKAGFDHALGECVITLDCDLEHPPEYISKMIQLWREGTEVVISVRQESSQLSSFKRVTSKFFYRLNNTLSEVPIKSGSADFRLLDKKVVEVCKAITENELFWRGLIPWLGFKTQFIPYDQGMRVSGATKYSLSKMLKLSLAGITSFSVRPLFLSFYIGIFFLGSSSFYLIYRLFKDPQSEKTISGIGSVIAAVVWVSGVQMMMLGILGIYLGKLWVQSRNRPQYLIGRTLHPKDRENQLKKVG